MIIGVTGLIGSGKGAVATMLVARSFIRFGCSDIIAEEVRTRGLEVTRAHLIMVGNEIREREGSDALARRIIAKIQVGNNYVVEGFRNIAEVKAFRELPDFLLLGVAAGKQRRMHWVFDRKRVGDPNTLAEFDALEQRDFLQFTPHGQQNALCFALSDYYLSNEGTLAELRTQLFAALHQGTKAPVSL